MPGTPAPHLGEGMIRRAVPVMGTVVSIHVRAGSAPRSEVYVAIARARALLHRADAVFSTWKAESPMSRIRRGEPAVDEWPGEVAEVLARCQLAKELSHGWFDPWAAEGGVDPTGLVKGWAAAQALAVLRDTGVAAAMVSAGGDVAVYGSPQPGRPWRIGIQNPFDRGSVIAVAHPPGAIATSGTYERGTHLFDPFTGRPAVAVASATVTGPELDLADALATALAVGGEASLGYLEAVGGYEAMIIGADGSLTRTSAFPLAPVEPPVEPLPEPPVAATLPASLASAPCR